MTTASRVSFALAGGATATALSLSVLAGWQRGGVPAERVVWVAISVMLVLGAHLLPALIVGSPTVVRTTGTLLWGTCLVTACFGHVGFFVLAQQHAGERRASVVAAPAPASPRSLTVVMGERATAMAQLASANARYCVGHCVTLEGRRTTLVARVQALDAEARDIRREEATTDRVTAQRDALRADPVTSRLAALLGVTESRVDLLVGLVFAAVLEVLACLLWVLALRLPPSLAPLAAPVPAVIPGATTPAVAVTRPSVTGVVDSHAVEVASHEVVAEHIARRDDPVTSLSAEAVPGNGDDDVSRLVRDIAAGHLRPTVADIRHHLRCGQRKASALRRQLDSLNHPA